MKSQKYIFIFFICLVSQAQSIRTFVDSTKIQIGRQAHLYIEFQKDKASDFIVFPTFEEQDSLQSGFEVMSVDFDTLELQGEKLFQQKIGFTAWEKGNYEVKPIAIKVNNDTLFTKVFTVEVTEPQPKEELNDIKDIIYYPKTWWQHFLDYLPFILVIMAVIALIFYWRRKKKKERKEADIQPMSHQSLNEKTIQELNDLQSKHWIEKGKVKDFYSSYSEILKEYFSERFHIPAKELFTSDLLYELENRRKLSEENIRKLKVVLKRADLAKFAKIKPSAEQGEEDIQIAKQIIESVPVESLNFYDEG